MATISGSHGSDNIKGTSKNDVIKGGAGNDIVKGKKPKGRNLGWRYGTKGGKYNERISKKGNRYRQYF